MAQLGYDAITLGNHEFDYHGQGLAGMLRAAMRNSAQEGTQLPALLCANIDWSAPATDDSAALQAAMEEYGARPAEIFEVSGVKVGIFGVTGVDAEACIAVPVVEFIDVIEAAKVQVAWLKAQGAEVIICLSHGGVWADAEKSEDELLAQAVPEIDLIVSGHTHTTLNEPIVHGTTYIASCGEYTRNLGRIVLERSGDDWVCKEYELIPTTDDVVGDAAIEEILEVYRGRVSDGYLARFGYTFDQVLCNNPGGLLSEYDLLTDALYEAVRAVEGENYEPVAMAIIPDGIIRGKLPVGEVRTTDAFNVLSLGIGPDRAAGYPLISVYLTGRELYDVAEVDASVSALMTGVHLYPSGGGWEYMNNRLLLSKVADVWLYDEEGRRVELEEDKLYRVVADLCSGQMLGSVKSKSFGLLSIEPKNKDGSPVTDFESCIIRNAQGEEIKLWATLADYLYSMGGTDGTGSISAAYQQPSERIVRSEAQGIGDHLRHAGRIWYVLAAAVVIVLLVLIGIVLIIRAVVRRVLRRRRKK